MPLYDYQCSACGRRFEVVHGVHAEGPTACPICGNGPVRKVIAAPAIHFKGTGWAKKERRATASPGTSKSGDEPGGESKRDDGSSDGDAKPGQAKGGPSKAGAGGTSSGTATGGSDHGSKTTTAASAGTAD